MLAGFPVERNIISLDVYLCQAQKLQVNNKIYVTST